MPLEESIGPIFQKTTNIIKNGFVRRGKALRSAVSLESIGFGLSMGAEELRTWFVNPQSSMIMKSLCAKEGKPLPLPTITPENVPPILYDVLSHMGDFWEGYFIPYVVHNLSTILMVEVSPKVRLAVSIGVADAIITMHELGLFNGQNPDIPDIPAGVAGSLLYLLIHNYTEKRLQEIDAKNANLKTLDENPAAPSTPVIENPFSTDNISADPVTAPSTHPSEQ